MNVNLNELNHKKWFQKALDDELNAKSILTHRDGTPSMVCFVSQQMAEKYLKAFLVYKSKSFPKIHDLLSLASILLNFLSKNELGEIKESLILLNRYYSETRYPGDFPEFTWKDAEEAFAAANKIKEFVLRKINLF